MLRTTNPQHSLWEAILPEGCLGLPAELARVDTLLDNPAFLAPLASHFDPRIGRPSVPLDTYLQMMFLKFRYRLGYELVTVPCVPVPERLKFVAAATLAAHRQGPS